MKYDIYTLSFNFEKYADNDNLAIQIDCKEDGEEYIEPFAMLTVNLGQKLEENMAYIDSNNCPRDLIDELILSGMIIPTGKYRHSGFCKYPLCEITPLLEFI